MDQKKFQSLLTYYLSCMDAEEATQLTLRKNQEYRTYIFLNKGAGESLFSRDLPLLDVALHDAQEKKFIEQKSPDGESLVDLHYGFPVFKDERDMMSPLFFVEAAVSFADDRTIRLLPKIKNFLVNRAYFLKRYNTEEIQNICDELEGEFGSFEARMKAAGKYIPSLTQENNDWMQTPILFRTNKGGIKDKLRYELGQLFRNNDVLAKETALSFFVQGSKGAPAQKKKPVLETGALNQQQEDAVGKGLQAPLTVVTGPPGTGKTQVVTALIASAVFNGQTVLFASNNNMPVDGVYQRLGLSMESAGNWTMRLGNQAKTEECRKCILSLLDRLKTMGFSKADLDQEMEKFAEIDRKIQQTLDGIQQARALQEKISDLYQKEAAAAQELPEAWLRQFTDKDPAALDAGAVKKYKKHSAPGLLFWLRCKFSSVDTFREKHNTLLTAVFRESEGIADFSDWLLIGEDWLEAVEKSRKTAGYVSHHQSWAMCIAQRRLMEEKMAQFPSTVALYELKQEKSAISQKLLDKKWLGNIYHCQKDAQEAANSYFKDIEDRSAGRFKRLRKSLDELKRFFPVWITTNQSVNNAMPLQAGLFDLVVIDEAGQCDIPSVIPLLYRAKRAVIIGDPQQFRHITSLKDDTEHALVQATGLEDIIDDWSYTRRSAFDRAFAATDCAAFLKQHYRCHPDIIEFSNCNFYEGKLVAQTSLSQFHNRLPIEESGLIWHHTAGNVVKERKGAWNPVEVGKTVELFGQWERQGLFAARDLTYGVVTPFRRQVEELKKAFAQTPWFRAVESRFTIGTVHSFQGSECDVLVYSPVVAENMDRHLVKFAATQDDLINVTVTRAKNLLCIVGDISACQEVALDTPLYQLANYAEKLRKQQRHPLNFAEKSLADILDGLKLSYAPQYEIGEYRLDFAVNAPSGERYNVEVDGDVHLTAEAVRHDARRDAFVKSQGFKVLRFTARDISHRPQAVKERLMRI